MEHLGNCHNEWLILFQFLGTVPFFGFFLKNIPWLKWRTNAHNHEGEHEHLEKK